MSTTYILPFRHFSKLILESTSDKVTLANYFEDELKNRHFFDAFENTTYKKYNSKHPAELLRIFITDSSKEPEIQKFIENIINDIPENGLISKSDFNLDDSDKIEHTYGKNHKASGKFNSFKIPYKGSDYFITISAGIAKKYTPSQLLKDLENTSNIPYEQVDDALAKVSNQSFAKIYEEAIVNVKEYASVKPFYKNLGDDESDSCTFKSNFNPKLLSSFETKFISSLMNDFGEILSAGCFASALAKALKTNNISLTFPDSATYPLVDVFVNVDGKNEIKISEKAGLGAVPSSESIITMLKNSKQKFSKKLQSFIEFMFHNVIDVNVHQGYENLQSSPFVKPEQRAVITNIMTQRISKIEKLDKLIQYVQDQCKTRLKYDKNREMTPTYFNTLVTRYTARLAINNINSDVELMSELNTAIKNELGNFIQLYLKSTPTQFLDGNLVFEAKAISSNNKFIFYDASTINKNSDKLWMQRLGLKLV